MKSRIFNIERFSIDEIINELYNPSKLGGTSISNFLRDEFRIRLLEEIKANSHLFRKEPREKNGVLQEMETFSMDFDELNYVRGRFPNMYSLMLEYYIKLYERIGEVANFQYLTRGLITTHHYKKGSIGVTPHRDVKKNINIISSFSISGKTHFYVCADRNKTDSVELDSSPGSLILLRAIRGEEGIRFNPNHYVEDVQEDRYSIVFRHEKI